VRVGLFRNPTTSNCYVVVNAQGDTEAIETRTQI